MTDFDSRQTFTVEMSLGEVIQSLFSHFVPPSLRPPLKQIVKENAPEELYWWRDESNIFHISMFWPPDTKDNYKMLCGTRLVLENNMTDVFPRHMKMCKRCRKAWDAHYDRELGLR